MPDANIRQKKTIFLVSQALNARANQSNQFENFPVFKLCYIVRINQWLKDASFELTHFELTHFELTHFELTHFG
jgi:hypothetical protein